MRADKGYDMKYVMLWSVYQMLQQRKHRFPEIHELACKKLINIDVRACNNIPEAVTKLALSARLVHSCETEE